MNARVAHTHWPARFEHDASAVRRADYLLDQREAVFQDVGRSRTERVRVAVAEGVSHHEVGIRLTQFVMVRENNPRFNVHADLREAFLGVGEGVRAFQPGGLARNKPMSAPGFCSNRHVARRVGYLNDAMQRVQGTHHSTGVILAGERHHPKIQRRRALRRGGVTEVVPGIRITDDLHQRGTLPSNDGLNCCM